MELKPYLAELGYSEEEITQLMADPKAVKAVTAALSKYSEGTTALTKAEQERRETAEFWEQKTVELQGSVSKMDGLTKRAAQAESEAARRTAYLKTLKEQGYDVPDELIGASTTTSTTVKDPDTGRYVTREDFERGVRATAPDLVSLTALSNEYRSLFGSDYVSIEDDFKAAQQAGKPLREYARSKYNFEGKRNELAQKKDQERIDAIVNERLKAKETELAAKYGQNEGLRIPVPSKFDKLEKMPGFKNESWKSPEGRKANRQARLKAFENADFKVQ